MIGTEAFCCLINRAISGWFLSKSIIFGSRAAESLVISHLLYADDAIVFCEASQD